MNAVREAKVNAVMVVSTLVEVTDARAQAVSVYTAEELAWVIMNLLEIILGFHMTSSKFKLRNYRFFWDSEFHEVLQHLNTFI